MLTVISLDKWSFFKDVNDLKGGKRGEEVTLPHTWNNLDGQDGGNDYHRGTCWYARTIQKPDIPAGGRVYLEFDGAAHTLSLIHISEPTRRSV